MATAGKWTIWFIALLSVVGAAEFWNLGQHAKHYYHHEPISGAYEWIDNEHYSSLDQSDIACPSTGRIVGNVYHDTREQWKGIVNATFRDAEGYEKKAGFDESFKDKEHAERAVENFVKKYDNYFCKQEE